MSDLPPVCLITGGTSGIGLATAIRFAKHGFRVALCGRNATRLQAAERAVAQAAENNESGLAVNLDVSVLANCQSLVAQTAGQFGRIDVLINNAGVAPLAPIVELTDADFESVVAVNQQAIFATTRAVWPIMQRQSAGTIVNISSQSAVDPFPGFSLYGASKAWVDLFTKATAEEGNSHGIHAFSLRLGAVETPMLRGLFPDFPNQQTLAPQAVADFIFCVASEPMRFASGSAIPFKR